MRDTLARAVAALAVMVLTTSAPAGQSPVRYIYDGLGRLIAVIDTSGAAAIYSYDAVGNLLSIVRQNTGVVSILEFSPNGGSIGQGVRLYGTGFSATPSQNTVTFNGVSATVTSSTTTEIVTTVPATATTGTIAVTTPSGGATSATAFVVGTSDAPTISSV
jgi:YD repeat-containing protein